MTLISTITLSPAVDISSEADLVRPTHKIRTSAERYDPGGGGINVARVIGRLGGDVEAVFLAGGATGSLLDELLGREGVRRRSIQITEPTRISFAVYERETGLEYRFVPGGPVVDAAALEACLAYVRSNDSSYVVASGSLPRGAPSDILARIAGIVTERGGRFVLDSSGDGLRATLATSPVFMVKPSRGELEQLVGHALDEQGIRETATDLVQRGAASLVVVSMGSEGVLLASAERVLRVPALHVPVRSAIGAGDSFLGAMTLALARGEPVEAAVRLGIAAGAAAVLRPGTQLCRPEDVQRLLGQLCLATRQPEFDCGQEA